MRILNPLDAEVLEMIKSFNPDMVIAGPAFNAGRYGMAAATMAAAVTKELKIKAFTAMYEENPGVDVFRKNVHIVKTSNSAAGMRTALPAIAAFAKKYYTDEAALDPATDNFFSKGIRVNQFVEQRGSTRAIDMLVKKIKGEEYATEYPMPTFDRVDPSPAIKDLSKAKIAIVTSGGMVPKHNPDHIESSSASKYGEYDISGLDTVRKPPMKLPTADSIRLMQMKIRTELSPSMYCEIWREKELSVNFTITSIQQLVTELR